jgi:hypothetical protein
MSDDSQWALLCCSARPAPPACTGRCIRYYRNTDKSHAFERETEVEAKPVTGSDARKVDEIKGTRETRIHGDNVHAYRKRVQRIRGDSS